MSTYTMTITLPTDDLGEAERQVRDALQQHGFGVLSEIDVEATLRAKLGDEVGDEVGSYKILGACAPDLARRAIGIDPDVGALLPCNVLLRRNPAGGTDVVAADPLAMMALGPAELTAVAEDARRSLDAALTALRGEV